MVDLDVFLDVTGACILSVTALECVPSRLEEGFVRAEGRFDVVSGRFGHLFAELSGPKGPMPRNLIRGGHSRLVMRVISLDRAGLSSACGENGPRLGPLESISIRGK